MKSFIQSWQLWTREWRQPSFRLLWIALFIAVVTVASITAFTSRLGAVFDAGAARFLGGDQVVESSKTMPASWLEVAHEKQLQTAMTLEFPSMLNAGGQMQLVSIKAVDEGYPLKGEVNIVRSRTDIAALADDEIQVKRVGPSQGEVWIAPRLFKLLGLKIGDMVSIGRAQLKIGALLYKEPDPNFSLMNVAPRVMMHYADVAATGVVQPGSRLRYRLLLAGDAARLTDFNQAIEPEMTASQRIVAAREGRPAVSNAVQRAERYLLLGGVLGVLLAAVALTITAQFYAQQQKDTVALLKTLGFKTGQMLRRFAVFLGISAATAIIAGLFAGWLAERWAAWAMRDLLPPLSGNLPVTWIWLPVVTLAIVLLAFAWPIFLGLAKEPPMIILRRGAANQEMQRLLGFSPRRLGFAALGFGVLLWIYSGEPVIVISVLAGLAGMIVLASGLMRLWLKVSPPGATLVPGALRSGAEQLKRRPWATVPHILALGSAWSLLLTLFLIRTELIDNWQAQIPEDAPNHFLVNIAPYEVEAIGSLLKSGGVESAPLYPMVRGRLTEINDVPVKKAVSKEEEIGALNRELNLTWMDNLPADNRILEGRWWNEEDAGESGSAALPGVSVESRLAERLGLVVGDKLAFTIGSQPLTAQVQSIRSVQWDSLKPNFYMAFHPGALDGLAATYITSAYIPKQQSDLVNDINRQFPTVSVLELDQFVVKVREIIRQVTLAIEALLILIFAAALLVVASLLAREVPVRRAETALYRALGAHRKVVVGAVWGEFALIGGMAGILGLIVAELVAGFLQHRLFEMPFSPHWGLWITVPIISALSTALYAYWRLLSVLKAPPHGTLQSGFVE
ncbi:ABC transporter permease [Hahella sp. CCB-MM4]|uniref:ABC transporter permease n=1 Tax=Hahella sp. (strain CCB-MM4) TaxID=1926491 RepID=UPI000B9A252B|nr:FtsX-like permease family protein [Hahella sp. CCB-MM4]OZG72087.1 ABC transporter permease [Hahella sp. CCB-MM4]